jgi:hypothetical protein
MNSIEDLILIKNDGLLQSILFDVLDKLVEILK